MVLIEFINQYSEKRKAHCVFISDGLFSQYLYTCRNENDAKKLAFCLNTNVKICEDSKHCGSCPKCEYSIRVY